MRKRNFTKRAIVGAMAVSMLFAGSAFTASNTVTDHAAGTGTAAVSGVNVTEIAYVLTSDRTQIAEVNFKHDNTDVGDATAQVQFTSEGDWYDTCTVTNDDGTGDVGAIACTIGAEDFEAADALTLVVGDNLTAEPVV